MSSVFCSSVGGCRLVDERPYRRRPALAVA
jgi:hypothetical protein